MDFEKWILNQPKPSTEPMLAAVKLRRVSVEPEPAAAPDTAVVPVANYFRRNAESSGDVNELIVPIFDPAFYRDAYGDLSDLGADEALVHFWNVGWLEGRNPNGWFDTCSYLEMNDDIRQAGVNPFLHYVGWGRAETRMFRKPIPVRELNEVLFDDPDLDWFTLVAPAFDEAFYAAQFGEPIPEGLSLLAHYLYRGWRENRLPHEGYVQVEQPLEIGEAKHFVPPIVIQLVADRAPARVVRKARAPADEPPQVVQVVRKKPARRAVIEGAPVLAARRQMIELDYRRNVLSAEQKLELSRQVVPKSAPRDVSRYWGEVRDIALEFDRDYYLAINSDVKEAGVDPVEHYFNYGWREGRDPTPWFSTRYYLDSNPDVAAADINPFWHYLVAGKAELRAPRKQGSVKRDILDTLQTPEQRTADYVEPEHIRLKPAELKKKLAEAVAGRDGIVWSSSHDCYPVITGGTQIFIADEERRFASLDIAYIHASPLRGSLLMNDAAPEQALTRLVMNGAIVGVATDAEIAKVVTALDKTLPADRTYVVHSVLGHSLSGMLAIRDALAPMREFFWLHDYSSICSGYNLLRNDIEHCHAPPIGSQACNVCIFGQSRARHVSLVARLFQGCDFTVASPSEVTLSIWKSATNLSHRGSVVLEHCAIEDIRSFPDARDADEIGLIDSPVKVAFVGYPTSQKGWPTFASLVDETRELASYQFFHFAKPGAFTHAEGVTTIEAEVSAGQRQVMSDLLASHGIDFVVMAAPWPETFSYVLFEALAAGCDIITVPTSGNIAAVVEKSGRGFVLADDAGIIDFFTDYSAVSYMRARARYGVERGRLVHKGTTAAIHPKTAKGA
ncbi:hypothetical protein [Rhizobium sp.]